MANWNFEVEPKRKKPKRKFIKFEKLILFENDEVIVINKPAGIASLDERGNAAEEISLLRLAQKYCENAQLAHRLDKNTSGVLIIAKTPDAYRDLSLQFQDREVNKHYLALVHGHRKFDNFVIDAPILATGKGGARISTGTGKESVTIVDTEALFRDFTLVSCQPLTGRLHQIRLHLSSVGAPLVGDEGYGGKDIFLSDIKKNFKYNRKMEEPPINKGFLLHARGIQFRLPGSEEEKIVVADLPKDFNVALKILGKYNKNV